MKVDRLATKRKENYATIFHIAFTRTPRTQLMVHWRMFYGEPRRRTLDFTTSEVMILKGDTRANLRIRKFTFSVCRNLDLPVFPPIVAEKVHRWFAGHDRHDSRAPPLSFSALQYRYRIYIENKLIR